LPGIKVEMNRSISPDVVSFEIATSSLIRSYNTEYRSGDQLMEIIVDKLGADLTGLLDALRVIAPDLWMSSERRFMLPQKLEDLEKPEYLLEMKAKIGKLKQLKDLLDADSISNEKYIFLRDKILFR